MKRFITYLIFPVFLLISCSELDISTGSGEPVSADFLSIGISLPGPPVSRASADGDGSGGMADRCRLQIWSGDELLGDYTEPVKDFRAVFENIYLRDLDDYLFLFWADNAEGDYYRTDSLTKVTVRAPYTGCNDARDAFCRCLTGAQVKAMAGTLIMLHRPFGQINVVTSDMMELYDRMPVGSKSLYEQIVPGEVAVSFRMPSVFNVATGVATDTVEVNYRSGLYSALPPVSAGVLNTLSMDYIFADAEEKSLSDLSVIMSGPDMNPIGRTFSNLPVKRNWRTNVIGALLTGSTEVTVSLSDDWDGEFDKTLSTEAVKP